jgi:hypothetical protein
MNKLIILAVLVAIAAAATPRETFMAKGKEMLESNPCYQEKLVPVLMDLASNVNSYKENPTFEILDAITVQIASIKAGIKECQINEMAQVAGGDIIETTGVALLLLSNCSRDLGGTLLILDSIIQDPSDLVNDIFALIFTGIIGYQAYNDCSQFINYIL